MSPLSPKANRRLVRRIENDAFARDARYWSGQKTIWSDSGTIRRPVSGAVRLVKPRANKKKRKAKKRDVNVYLFRVNTKGSDEVFLKIGVTNSLTARFEEDRVRYKFWLLCHVGDLTRREAIVIEKRLHELFLECSYRPRCGFVTGGHTECFVDHNQVVETTKAVFALVEEEKAALRERLITAARLEGYSVGELPKPTIAQHIVPPAPDPSIAIQEGLLKAAREKSGDAVSAFNRQVVGSLAKRKRREQSQKDKLNMNRSVKFLKNQSL